MGLFSLRTLRFLCVFAVKFLTAKKRKGRKEKYPMDVGIVL